MLKNPNAAKIMENLKWFCKNDIPFHVQIVLCPGYNDGMELKRTLNDLNSLGDCLLSVAIVPVGVTDFRKETLKTVDSTVAKQTIEIASEYDKVCCSDEFFLLADKKILVVLHRVIQPDLLLEHHTFGVQLVHPLKAGIFHRISRSFLPGLPS